MKKYMLGVFATTLFLGLNAAPVQAFHCPVLVKECLALVGKLESRADTEKDKLSKAKRACQAAQELHEDDKHKGAVAEVSWGISMAGKAAAE